jgi:hypothetical protein
MFTATACHKTVKTQSITSEVASERQQQEVATETVKTEAPTRTTITEEFIEPEGSSTSTDAGTDAGITVEKPRIIRRTTVIETGPVVTTTEAKVQVETVKDDVKKAILQTTSTVDVGFNTKNLVLVLAIVLIIGVLVIFLRVKGR